MMYPRLVLARQLLHEDGVIMVSIADQEVHHLRSLMNEVFGETNFIASVIWQKVYAPKNSARHFSEDHDYIIVYAKNGETWRPNLLPRSDEADSRYVNFDEDPRGDYKPDNLLARNYYSKGEYIVTSPSGKQHRNPTGTYWRVSKQKFDELDNDNRIWWGEDGSHMPALKRFLTEVKQGIVPQTLWTYKEVGHTQKAKKELLQHVSFEHTENVFNTIKPTGLIKRMLQIATDDDGGDIVLDFFAGSGSTGHAVLAKNQEDSGDRRFILVQFPEQLPTPETNLKTIADIAKERLRSIGSEIEEASSGNGRDVRDPDVGFKVYRLDRTLFSEWSDYEGGSVREIEDLFAQQETPLVDGWTRPGLLTEVLLLRGYPLDSTVEPVTGLDENEVLRVTTDAFDADLYVCLDETVHADTIAALELDPDDTFVCLDTALTDQDKVRLLDKSTLFVI